jgi:hypothetical protein
MTLFSDSRVGAIFDNIMRSAVALTFSYIMHVIITITRL